MKDIDWTMNAPATWQFADAVLKRDLEHPIQVPAEVIKQLTIERAVSEYVLREMVSYEIEFGQELLAKSRAAAKLREWYR